VNEISQNPVVLKVLNGTQRSDVHLCQSCRGALHIKASQSSAEILICLQSPPPHLRITQPVGQCTGYLDRTKPTLWDMQQIAWQLMTDKGGRKIGFLSPEEMQQRNGNGPVTGPP
jgi:hypothetical protein